MTTRCSPARRFVVLISVLSTLGNINLSVKAFGVWPGKICQISATQTRSSSPWVRRFSENDADGDSEHITDRKPCFYRGTDGRWRQRLHLNDLQVGQALTGKVVQELLDGKTGPKIFFECGVGRTDDKGDWHMVHGMMRLGGRGSKASVAKKKATRLRRKTEVELYVSRIHLDNGRLEVCGTPEEVERYKREPKIPASTLKPNQELVGTVTRLLPYGVFVDVGANRRGLLHIQKVADLYGRYIDKERGLEEAGLERGARIKVAVDSNERKRLFLDFTPDAKAAAEEERMREEEETVEVKEPETVGAIAVQDTIEMSEEEAAAWAAYGTDEPSGQSEEEGDGFDEDAAIEDAFGLGSY